ncbi:MAG: glutamate 5-kinase [Desulfonatronovibrionaceae bacterium]
MGEQGRFSGIKKEALDRAHRVVIKVGSAVLTDRAGLDLRVVNRLADQIALLQDQGREIVLVSSGAVAAGRGVMRSRRITETLRCKQAVSAVGQSRLMHAYDEAFARYRKTTAQVLLTREDLKSRERFLNARNTMLQLLQWQIIPVVNENDTVAVQELKFGDNDSLASLVLNLVEADLFINLTSEDGVFDKNPQEFPDAELLPVIADIDRLPVETMCCGKSVQGSGGMYSKLISARRAAQIGVPTLILSGRNHFALEKAFSGEELGTLITAGARAIARRKFWLAYNLDPAGEIVMDSGAVRAVRERGKSLLPAGITDVRGEFGKGDMVRLVDGQGNQIGAGLSNYESSELRRIKGSNSGDIQEILGHCMYTEAVHRDNMLLDAAL